MRVAPIVRRVVIGLSCVACAGVVKPPEAAAWGEPSRPPAGAASPGGINQAPAKRGPLFHGQELRLPSLPFLRQKQKPAAPEPRTANARPHPQQSAPARTAHPAAAAQSAARVGGVATTGSMPPGATASPAAPNGQQQRSVVASNGSNGAQPHTPYSNRTPSTGPTDTASRLAAAHHSEPTPAPQQMAKAAETKPAASSSAPAQQSPADRLVAQAHELTTTAESEDDFTRIVETCRRARASQPSPAAGRYANELASWALNRRGQLRAETGRFDEAMRDFDDAVQADPQRWRPVHNRGVLLAQAGELARAFDDFSRTIELNPEFAKAYSNRAALYIVAGSLEPALADYARAVELDPTLAVAHRGLGRACHLLGQFEEALEHYNAAVRLTPDDGYAASSRADVLTDLGHYAEALAEYDRAIQLAPKSSRAYSGSGWVLATCPDASLRQPQLAIERANRAIELGGRKDAMSFDTLAAAQASLGDFSSAVETLRQAVHLAPADERQVYEQRLLLYQHARPYRIAPPSQVVQASYEAVK